MQRFLTIVLIEMVFLFCAAGMSVSTVYGFFILWVFYGPVAVLYGLAPLIVVTLIYIGLRALADDLILSINENAPKKEIIE